MIIDKRITILCGHYGSGKTNVAINLATASSANNEKVTLYDIDIANPYFRAAHNAEALKTQGISLVASLYANSAIDVPALPREIYSITNDKSIKAILDVGGDDRGALALGRIAKAIKDEDNYEMLFVINMYRPLTRAASDTLVLMHEIEYACRLKFTAIVNNSNLGAETAPQTILDSIKYADEVSTLSGLPIAFTAVRKDLFNDLEEKISNLFCIAI